MRNVLASPLPPRAYIRVCFACSGRLEAEEEGAGRLCPPLPSRPCPLATQFQLRCNARSFAQRARCGSNAWAGKTHPNSGEGHESQKPLISLQRTVERGGGGGDHSVVCILERAPSMKMGGAPLLLDFIFFKARSPRALPFCIEATGRRFGFAWSTMELSGF